MIQGHRIIIGVKHLMLKTLWLQDFIRGRNGRKKVELVKIATAGIRHWNEGLDQRQNPKVDAAGSLASVTWF